MMRRPVSVLAAVCTVAALLVSCATETDEETTSHETSAESSSVQDTATFSAPATSSSQPLPTSTPPSQEEIARDRIPTDQRAKIASLMVVGVTDFDDALEKLEQGAGGIFIASWSNPELLTQSGRNIVTLREIIDRPFSVSIDFEGGRVQRHAEILGTRKSPRQLAESKTPAEVEEYARHIGDSLRWHGVTVNFAPVLDVETAHLDVVGDRAFSRDPEIAGKYGAAFARGLAAANISPVYKHFPGHGQASGDTHLELAVTPPLAELAAHDLRTYSVALKETPAAVMMGHMLVPDLGDGTSPASLDPAAYELLRSGDYPAGVPFNGLVFTDDLSGMRAITDHYSLPDAVSMALSAGADQALFSTVGNFLAVLDGVEEAMKKGQIPAEQIDESAYRVQQQLLETGH